MIAGMIPVRVEAAYAVKKTPREVCWRSVYPFKLMWQGGV